MVSPSKIFKSSNSELKIGIGTLKKDGLKTHGACRQKSSSSSQTKNSLFFVNTKFYLDIRNRAQLAKVESTLKSYGAKIEVFFSKDVKIIVTDRTEWIGNGRSPSASISPLTTPSPSSNQDQRFAVPKSRATAMLEKVSQQPTSPYSSPLELAQKWRIPILPVPSLWKWIAKVKESFLADLKEKKKQKEILENKIVVNAGNSPFIKIESFVSPHTPEFLELGSWPRLYLDGHLGQCPFRSPSPVTSDENPKGQDKLFDVKSKVAVEYIQYNTDFRIKDNIKSGECEAELNADLEKNIRSNIGLERNNVVSNEDDTASITDSKQNSSPICNGHAGRNITRQSSQELLKVQCNGLTISHRNSKLLSPSGSDVLPLPSSRRSTRRASASWCGSTRELSQLSPTDSEIENIRRSDSSLEAHDPALDSPGITLRPKGQLWLPIALIGTTAEENGNCIRKRYDYSIRQSENAKLSSDLLDPIGEEANDEIEQNQTMPKVSKESDSNINLKFSSQNDYQFKRNTEKKDGHCIITRKSKIKNSEMNGRSRESSIESRKSDPEELKSRMDGKKRSLSVCGRSSPSVKRTRTMSTNSVHSVGRKKKLSPEEKLLQDNREYFKMEVLNNKLRSSGSLLNVSQVKEQIVNGEVEKSEEKIDKIIIKKIKLRGRKKKSKWTKASEKKGDVNYETTIIIENKKNNNVKINGVIRKKRQSELMKLCNEAESFMFGESSRQGSATIEGEAEDTSRKKNNSSLAANMNEETAKEVCGELEGKRRKKRRSHAEAFIHDNLDYYKFETPGSRLRYQGSFLDVKSEDKDFIYTLKQKKKERLSSEQNRKNELLERFQIGVEVKDEKLELQEKKRNPVKPSEEIEKILFSFESIPSMEPWYEVYKRQDEGMENYYPLLSDPNDQPFLLPYEMPKPAYPKSPTVSEYYKRRRKKLVHLFNHPRKSPRCHASTLAILSSLKKRKRKSGVNISMNSMLAESPPSNSNLPEEGKLVENEKTEGEIEEILSFLYEEDVAADLDEIIMEPFSDSEGKPKRKNSDSCKSVKSDEDDGKNLKAGNRNKKPGRFESQNDVESEEEKHFSLQNIKPDFFFKDMVIEIRKKSGLNINIATILENLKNRRNMEELDEDLISELKGSSGVDGLEKSVRIKRKKARKINKTGWDNRKSRRRTGNKMTEVKEVESEVTVPPESIKKKVRMRQNGINSENIILGSKKRGRKKASELEDRLVLRSHLEGGVRGVKLRRCSQDTESRSESLDSVSREYPPCIVRVKKLSESNLSPSIRLRYSNAKFALQKRRLVLSRKKKRVIDYAWTTRRR